MPINVNNVNIFISHAGQTKLRTYPNDITERPAGVYLAGDILKSKSKSVFCFDSPCSISRDPP